MKRLSEPVEDESLNFTYFRANAMLFLLVGLLAGYSIMSPSGGGRESSMENLPR